jgi:ABC-type glycerol-3-phosphate transport system substrate-binding protein
LKLRHLLLPCLLLLSGLALAACGGGGGDSSAEEDSIEAAIVRSATTADPANCTEVETQAFVEQSSDESGAAALKECEKEAKDSSSNAKTVKVTKVKIDGSEATADAAITGGGFDGQVVSISLVEEDGTWKLDQLTGFAKLDTAKLAKIFGEKLEATGELSPEQTSCIVEGVEAAPKSQAEELVLSGSSQPLVELAEGCE